MFSLEIINALNDPDNPAKSKGLNAKLKQKQRDHDFCLNECQCGQNESLRKASEALDRREERNISHYGPRFRY